MVLPLYLAMPPWEMRPVPHPAFLMLDWEWEAPGGYLPVITDHRPLTWEAVDRLCRLGRRWEYALLDLENPRCPEAQALLEGLPCPAAVPPGMGDGPVFLPPCPLHVPLERWLAPWQGREIWMEAAMQRQTVTVDGAGMTASPPEPAEDPAGGFRSGELRCRFLQDISPDRAVFTLFDTPQTLEEKLDAAASLGVTRAIGLYAELGRHWG